MTKKLFNAILSTCLLFSSLYLPAQAETANKAASARPSAQIKKSPETNFLDGDTCLKHANTACAKLALANIPSTSAYAKLLQGSIAFSEKQTDKALLLLLPLQTEENLIPQAKISLHQYLASAFESLDDAQQAIQHLIQAETSASTSEIKDAQTTIAAIHDQIWAMLSKLEQAELIALRGNNTDNTFQGWIDLRLAASNQDLNSSIAGWSTSYPDHSAQMFAKTLTATDNKEPTQLASLTSEGSIALIMPLTTETYAANAEAFKLGLETALIKLGLQNEVKTYPSTENQQDMDEMYTLAKDEGNAYFIIPSFNSGEAAHNQIKQAETGNIVYIAPTLDDEARHIADFALSRGMQNITIISTDNMSSKRMTESFQSAWQSRANQEHSSDSVTIITLTDNISATDNSLFELKSQLAAKMPDMILLAMPATEIRMVRPHLQISIPTMTFSNANEIIDDAGSYHALNAVRLFDIPYLLLASQPPYKDYDASNTNLSSNALLRWFALGVDSLQLLISAQKLPDREISISGLSGMLTVDSAGNIQRQLSLARFTHNGIETEQ
ncbi:MAG TPA: penicillin-binding protein activator [Methylotenera sp.]